MNDDEHLTAAQYKALCDKAIHSTVSKGVKYDAGKPRIGLLFAMGPALVQVVRVLEHGLEKYPDAKNWQRVEDGAARYIDAAGRHLLDYAGGSEKDPYSGLHPLAHAACDVLFALWHATCRPVDK